MKLAALFRWPFWHRLEPSFFSGLPEQIDIANQHRKLPSRPPEKIISPQIWIICSEIFDDHEVRGHNWAQHLPRVQGRKKYHSKSRPLLVQSSGHSGPLQHHPVVQRSQQPALIFRLPRSNVERDDLASCRHPSDAGNRLRRSEHIPGPIDPVWPCHSDQIKRRRRGRTLPHYIQT
jgi:hypothetical protein